MTALNQNEGKYRVWWILAFFIIVSIAVFQSYGYRYSGSTAETLAWGFSFLCMYLAARITNRTIAECQQATLWMKVFVTIMLFVTAISVCIAYTTRTDLAQTKQQVQSLQAELQPKQAPDPPATTTKTTTATESSFVGANANPPPIKSSVVEEDIIANSRTGIFHRADCQYVSRMSANNMVPYSSRDDAIDDGYRPCKKCRP